MARLLRSERGSISSEAAVLAWIANLGSSMTTVRPGVDVKEAVEKAVDGESEGEEEDKGETVPVKAKPLTQATQSGTTGGQDLDFVQSLTSTTHTPIPVLLAHSPAYTLSEPEFNVVKPTSGSHIAALRPPLTPTERKSVDFQRGHLLRRLSKIRSTSGRFGPALGVLGRMQTPDKRIGNGKICEARGSSTWVTAFASLLEGVLRDGEDMHITLPYSTIRQQFWKLEHLLEAITIPALVVVGAADDESTLVIRRPKSTRAKSKESPEESNGEEQRGEQIKGIEKKNNEEDKVIKGEKEDEEDKGEEVRKLRAKTPVISFGDDGEDILVTGFRDWSNCVFGDPLLAKAFHKDPSESFWKGFKSALEDEPDHSEAIQDEKNAKTRMLLYECYHTITRVVREFYRPSKGSSKRELEARKALNIILEKLNSVAEPSSARRRRPSGEVSPAKRYKADDEEEDVHKGSDSNAS